MLPRLSTQQHVTGAWVREMSSCVRAAGLRGWGKVADIFRYKGTIYSSDILAKDLIL